MVRIVQTPALDRGSFERGDTDPVSIPIVEPLGGVPLPPTKEALVEAFRRFVSQQKRGGFERLLNQWIAWRLKAGLPVNPSPGDRSRTPKKLFKRLLEAAFREVRATR